MTAALEETRPRVKKLTRPEAAPRKQKRVVIIGGGFAGIAAARALRRCNAEIVLIDRRNHHIFQPLLYQIATAVLAPADIAAPIRQIEEKQKNLTVMLAEVTAVDLNSRSVSVSYPTSGAHKIVFDFLIIAAGAQSSYFGHDDFARYAPGLKNLSDAETIRTKILSAYELAELTDDESERSRLMTFVLVGAGPTGVELAASIAQMAAVTLRGNFRRIDPAKTSIVLIEGGNRVLPTFAESLSRKAARRLEKLGVKILTGTKVEKVDEQGVVAGGKRIPSATVLWTAGVAASPVVKTLGVPTDRAGRIPVNAFLMVPGANDVFVVGDVATLSQGGRPLPGVAQVAIQQGRYVGWVISRQLNGKAPRHPFQYFDKGNMAVIGKNFAVLERGRLRTSGFMTWLVWVFIHLMFLPQLQNRLRVQRQWLWSYWSGQRSSRLISEVPQGK
jgi:NADH:quinone reductase (non-electrogenic)